MFLECIMCLLRPHGSFRSFRLGAFTKFGLFLLFTIAYVYIALMSMPAGPKKRGASIKNVNITSKIMNRIDEQGIDLYAIEEEMNQRREKVITVCERFWIGKSVPNIGEFIFDGQHSLIWCKILKAASSTWVHYFNMLGGYDEAFLKRTKQNHWTLLRSKFPKPTLSQLLKALRSSFSFIIVREPLERLLSIYQTIASPINHKYYQQLKKKIKKSSGGGLLGRGTPSFSEFVKHVIKYKDSLEIWSPINKLCSPCFVNFTAIAKFETLQDDQEYIIKRVGIDDILKLAKVKLQFLAHRIDETKDMKLTERYSELDGNLILELLEMYRVDFEMFGYNSTKYYYMIKELVVK